MSRLSDADENVSFDLGDLGTGEARSDTSVTTWTKTAAGDRCQIDVVWVTADAKKDLL